MWILPLLARALPLVARALPPLGRASVVASAMLLLLPGPPSEHIAFDIDVSFRIAFDVYASFRILLNHLAVIQSLPLHLSSLLQLIFPGVPCDAQ